jgi:hypothetical protein
MRVSPVVPLEVHQPGGGWASGGKGSRKTLRLRPALQAALGTPLQRFEMELRPYYWFQPGTVASTAWLLDGRLVVLHRLLSPVPGGEEHGVAVERF